MNPPKKRIGEMSDDEKRIAIAGACGWTDMRFYQQSYEDHRFLDRWVGTPPFGGMQRYLPNYLYDLNAMHEAVKSLSDQQRHTYAVVLAMEVWPPHQSWCDWRDTLAVSEATPEQRAHAFLLTLGHEE